MIDVVGRQVFDADVISMNGLDDRLSTNGVIEQAQDLMAGAVDAEHAFFSNCGSSLSVKRAMLSVAGPPEKLLVARQSPKTVVSGLILSGVAPVWVRPQWDGDLHLSHPPIVDEAWGAHLPFHPDLPPWAMDAGADLCVTSVHKSGSAVEQSSVFHLRGDRVDPAVLKAREDLLGTTSPTSLVYATLDGWRRQMVQHGHELLTAALALTGSVRARIAELPGLRVMGDEFVGPDAAMSIDPLKVVVDVSGLGISGYQATDWLREHERVAMGLSDHRRIVAQLTYADDEGTGAILVRALEALCRAAGDLPPPKPVDLPSPRDMEVETVMLPRDAFFGEAEQVDVEKAVGRVAAEMITPYPPGAPAVLPGEVINQEVVDYLRSGLTAGMEIPDAADSKLETIRLVVRK